MNSSQCEFCQKVFSSVYNMKIHQKQTKTCMLLRSNEPIIEKIHRCEYCEKIFTASSSVKTHWNRCKMKLAKDREREIVKEY